MSDNYFIMNMSQSISGHWSKRGVSQQNQGIYNCAQVCLFFFLLVFVQTKQKESIKVTDGLNHNITCQIWLLDQLLLA